MTAAMPRMPVGAAGDSSDVAVALEVAGALWEKGDHEEGLRWLKRAIEAATAAGDGARASGLTQAASELEASIDGRKDAAAKHASLPSAVPPLPSDAPVIASRPPPMPAMPAHAPSPSVMAAVAPSWGKDARMRVSVRTSVRDPQLLVIRPLADGQTAPVGTREGFLVLADADPHTSNGGPAR